MLCFTLRHDENLKAAVTFAYAEWNPDFKHSHWCNWVCLLSKVDY